MTSTDIDTFTGACYDLANRKKLPKDKPSFTRMYGESGVRKLVLGTMLAQIAIVQQDVPHVLVVGFGADEEMERELEAKTSYNNGVLNLTGSLPFKPGGPVGGNRSFNNFVSVGDITMINGVVMGGSFTSHGSHTLIINGREVDLSRGLKLVLIVPLSLDLTVSGLIGAVGITDHLGGTLDFSPDYQASLYGASVERLIGDISGSGKIELEAVHGDADVEVSGSGSITIGSVSGSVDAKISGSGSCRIARGASRALTAKVSGSGNISHRGSVSGDARLRVSGSGNINVAQVAGAVDRKVSGSGKITANGQVYRPKW